MPVQQLPPHSQNMQIYGAPMQQNIHADCHSAAQCSTNRRLKPLEALYEGKSNELIKLRAEFGKLLKQLRKDQPEAYSLWVENDELRADIAKLKAELALSKVQETMLWDWDHIPGNNSTLHGGPPATTYPDTASSPQVLTPTSSSSNISADAHFPNNGTSQQGGETGQADQTVALLAAGVVADFSAMNSNSVAFHVHGGHQPSVPVTSNAVLSRNPAWTGAPSGQMQQNIDSQLSTLKAVFTTSSRPPPTLHGVAIPP